MRGRSDATLNRWGENRNFKIYQQVEDIDFITEGLVVGQDFKDDVRIILFVTTKNQELDDEKISLIDKNKKNCSPKHVPGIIIKTRRFQELKAEKLLN